MAGDWIKIKTGLELTINFANVANRLSMRDVELLGHLYLLASWFRAHSKYGVVDAEPNIIDTRHKVRGLGDALIDFKFIKVTPRGMMLGGFCNVSAIRKSIGSKMRSQILSGSVCNYCGSDKELQIDHIIPVALGGPTELENLQALCRECNIRKGVRCDG